MFSKGNPMNPKRIVDIKLEARELKCIQVGLLELQRGTPFENLSKEVKHAIHHFLVTT